MTRCVCYAATRELESAIDANLSPGAYTAVVRGNNDTLGVALIEVYDLSQAVAAKPAKISTRAFVGTGDNMRLRAFLSQRPFLHQRERHPLALSFLIRARKLLLAVA